MPRSLTAALSRVNRLATRLQLDTKPDLTKMSNSDLCKEAVELGVRTTGCRLQDFESSEEFVETFFSKTALPGKSFSPMLEALSDYWNRYNAHGS